MANTAKTSQSQMVTAAKDLGKTASRPGGLGPMTSGSGRNSPNGADKSDDDDDRSEGEQFSRNYLRQLNYQLSA